MPKINDGSRDLVYRAYIVRLDHLSSNQLLTYVDSWVKQEPLCHNWCSRHSVQLIHFFPHKNKGISIMNCPAYGSAYTPVKPLDKSCNAVVYDHTKDDPTTCIYDSIHDITDPPKNMTNHRRIAMTICAALDKDREAMEEAYSETEDTTEAR